MKRRSRWAEGLAKIADRYGLPLYTCAEKIDLEKYGIRHAACIDKEKIREIIGYKLDLKKGQGTEEGVRLLREHRYRHVRHLCPRMSLLLRHGQPCQAQRARRDEHDPKSPILIGLSAGG